MPETPDFTLVCPIPIADYPNVMMAHGGGGTLMRQLIEKMFLRAFGTTDAGAQHDSAIIEPAGTGKIAFTTDSYVVSPLFFPGGDIGSMAVYGTVNDLAMAGARARYLSAGFILEEGLPMETLWRVVRSMGEAARRTSVRIVTGDTKVVDRGKGDGVFINTAGIGVVESPAEISPRSVRVGDAILLSGDLGRHGIAVIASREGIEFETAIESDLAPLGDVVMALLAGGIAVRCLRDLTRGGLASALNEIAESAGVGIEIEESKVPVRDDVRGACELLGFDPLYVANEGRFVAFVEQADAERALEIVRFHACGANAEIAGRVSESGAGRATLKTRIGTNRPLDMLSGEQLPRIC